MSTGRKLERSEKRSGNDCGYSGCGLQYSNYNKARKRMESPRDLGNT